LNAGVVLVRVSARVRFRFDVNGDGDTTDPGEDQLANVVTPSANSGQPPLPRATAVFRSLSGAVGARSLTVEEVGFSSSTSTIHR